MTGGCLGGPHDHVFQLLDPFSTGCRHHVLLS
jgi:hypothetical protein